MIAARQPGRPDLRAVRRAVVGPDHRGRASRRCCCCSPSGRRCCGCSSAAATRRAAMWTRSLGMAGIVTTDFVNGTGPRPARQRRDLDRQALRAARARRLVPNRRAGLVTAIEGATAVVAPVHRKERTMTVQILGQIVVVRSSWRSSSSSSSSSSCGPSGSSRRPRRGSSSGSASTTRPCCPA